MKRSVRNLKTTLVVKTSEIFFCLGTAHDAAPVLQKLRTAPNIGYAPIVDLTHTRVT